MDVDPKLMQQITTNRNLPRTMTAQERNDLNRSVADDRHRLAVDLRGESSGQWRRVSRGHRSRSAAYTTIRKLRNKPEWDGFGFSVSANLSNAYDILARFPALPTDPADPRAEAVKTSADEWNPVSNHRSRPAARNAKNRIKDRPDWQGFDFTIYGESDGSFGLYARHLLTKPHQPTP